MDEQKPTGKLKEAQQDIRRRLFTYIATALGLVIGLAWNDAVSSLIKLVFPLGADSVLIKFLYALILTLVIGLALFSVEKLLNKEKS